MGPAIITEKKLFVDGKEIQSSGFTGYDDFVEKLDLADRYVGHGVTKSGASIKAGEKINIIYFNLFDADEADSLLMKVYSRVSIEIGYKSIYGELFKCRIPSNQHRMIKERKK